MKWTIRAAKNEGEIRKGVFAKQPVDNKEQDGSIGCSSSHALNLYSLSL
jgi:hypothetical protein